MRSIFALVNAETSTGAHQPIDRKLADAIHAQGALLLMDCVTSLGGAPVKIDEAAIAAVGDVRMHLRSRKPLLDALTATRIGRPVADCGHALMPNAEAHLRSRMRLATLFPADWLEQTLAIAGRCAFSLDELRYEYPEETCPPGKSAMQHLKDLTWAGAIERYCDHTPGDRNPWAFESRAKAHGLLSVGADILESRAKHCVPGKIVARRSPSGSVAIA